MTVAGWIFLSVSLAFVVSLALGCYYRVLTLPPREHEEIDNDRGKAPDA